MMRPVIRLGIALAMLLAVTGSAAWAVGPGVSLAIAGPDRAKAHGPREEGKTAPPSPTQAPNDSLRAQIKDVDSKLKALRGEFHSQLDPLEEQIKALREKYEPQIRALEDQRKTLVEQGKPDRIQQLDREEEADLAALAQREKAEIERLRQRFTAERKEIEQRYEERRKGPRGEAR